MPAVAIARCIFTPYASGSCALPRPHRLNATATPLARCSQRQSPCGGTCRRHRSIARPRWRTSNGADGLTVVPVDACATSIKPSRCPRIRVTMRATASWRTACTGKPREPPGRVAMYTNPRQPNEYAEQRLRRQIVRPFSSTPPVPPPMTPQSLARPDLWIVWRGTSQQVPLLAVLRSTLRTLPSRWWTNRVSSTTPAPMPNRLDPLLHLSGV